MPTRTRARPSRPRPGSTPASRSTSSATGWSRSSSTGPPGKAIEQFRVEDWNGAEAGFAQARCSRCREHGAERLAATLHAGAGARQPVRVGRRRARCSRSSTRATRSSRPTTPTTRPAAGCGAATAAGALEWAAQVAQGTVPEAETRARPHRRAPRARSLGRRARRRRRLPGAVSRTGPATPRRSSRRRRRSRSTRGRLARPTRGPRPPTRPPSTAGSGPRRRSRPGAIAPANGCNRSPPRLPAPEAAALRTRTAGELVTRGTVLFDRNRNAESEATFAAALGAPGLDADLECRARFYRAQSVWKARQRPRAAPLFDEAEAACARGRQPRSARQGALPGGALLREHRQPRRAPSPATRGVEAEHADHSYADDARIRIGGAGHRRRRRGGRGQDSGRGADPVPQGRSAERGALAAGVRRLARRTARRGARTGWTRTCASSRTRRSGTRRGGSSTGRGACWRSRGSAPRRAAWYERAVREYPLSVYALLALGAARRSLDPKAQAALVASLRKGVHDVPAWSFPPRAALRRARLPARRGAGAHGPGRRRAPRARPAGAGDVGRQARPARRGRARRTRISSGSRRCCSIAAASGAPRTRCPRYGVTNYRLEYPKGLGEAKWKLAYPRAFPTLVAKNTKANQLPEALQLAIMREESAFSPRIESFANAIGLTQMLVKTAKRFANGAPVTREVLLDPAKNLELGARFLGLPVEALRRPPRRWPSPATTRARRRSIAGWASAATWRWTSSWRRSPTTRPATTPSACSPPTSPTPGSTTRSRCRRCRSTRAGRDHGKPSDSRRPREASRAGRSRACATSSGASNAAPATRRRSRPSASRRRATSSSCGGRSRRARGSRAGRRRRRRRAGRPPPRR